MSEMGQTRSSAEVCCVIALLPKADSRVSSRHVAEGQQPTSGRSSRVGVNQISWSSILIGASADGHFNRDMAWQIVS
jgi:hypothetical protein